MRGPIYIKQTFLELAKRNGYKAVKHDRKDGFSACMHCELYDVCDLYHLFADDTCVDSAEGMYFVKEDSYEEE